jgi:hypothetical protein
MMKRVALVVAIMITAATAAVYANVAGNLPDASKYPKNDDLPVCSTAVECLNMGYQAGYDSGFQASFRVYPRD